MSSQPQSHHNPHSHFSLNGYTGDLIPSMAAYAGGGNGFSDQSGYGYGLAPPSDRGDSLRPPPPPPSQAPINGWEGLFPGPQAKLMPSPMAPRHPHPVASSQRRIAAPPAASRPPPPPDRYHQMNYDDSLRGPVPVPLSRPPNGSQVVSPTQPKRQSPSTEAAPSSGQAAYSTARPAASLYLDPEADTKPGPSSASVSPVPAKNPSVQMISKRPFHKGGLGGGSVNSSGVPKSTRELRNEGRPPKGVEKCASCGLTESPEWRKGETGLKDLCNAVRSFFPGECFLLLMFLFACLFVRTSVAFGTLV